VPPRTKGERAIAFPPFVSAFKSANRLFSKRCRIFSPCHPCFFFPLKHARKAVRRSRRFRVGGTQGLSRQASVSLTAVLFPDLSAVLTNRSEIPSSFRDDRTPTCQRFGIHPKPTPSLWPTFAFMVAPVIRHRSRPPLAAEYLYRCRDRDASSLASTACRRELGHLFKMRGMSLLLPFHHLRFNGIPLDGR